jgi:hypothetical protein
MVIIGLYTCSAVYSIISFDYCQSTKLIYWPKREKRTVTNRDDGARISHFDTNEVAEAADSSLNNG